MRSFLISISLVSALTISVAQARDFQSSSVHPLDYPSQQAVTYMGTLIEQRSGGKLGLKPLPPSEIGSENFLIGRVRNGTLDLARVNIESLNDAVETTIPPALPYIFKSRLHLRHVLDGPIGDEILAAIERQGLIGLCFYDVGSRSFYAKKPIRSVGDMRGMKVRMQSSTIWVATMKAINATAVLISYNQVHDALKTDLIDAAENTWTSYISSGDYEVGKFYSLTEHSMAPEVLVFSKKVWDGLSKEEQGIIRIAAKESVPYMRKLWDEREVSARKAIIDTGSQFVTDVDKKSFSDAMLPVRMMLLADPKLREMVTHIEATE